MSYYSRDIVFFFGAGSSAPFGIPTMKQLVVDFERFLETDGTQNELLFYRNLKETLTSILSIARGGLKKYIDLEDIFTVIDGYFNFGYERVGVLSLYVFREAIAKMGEFPSKTYDTDVEICRTLRTKFQRFITEKCKIPVHSFSHIDEVFQDFFNRIKLEEAGGVRRSGRFLWEEWPIFTTNYDTCLEHYWRHAAKINLNTGFRHDAVRRAYVVDPPSFSIENNVVRLFKLHGSISWKIKSDGIVTEEQTIGQSLVGFGDVGEMMIYPVQEKELYLEPYVTMFSHLNNELRKKSIWIIVGYSFNDPAIREIFLRNATDEKRIIVVHPDANAILANRLSGMKGEVGLITHEFGLENDFRMIDYQIVNKLTPTLKHNYESTPTA